MYSPGLVCIAWSTMPPPLPAMGVLLLRKVPWTMVMSLLLKDPVVEPSSIFTLV
jgi:hypothetical protein